MGILDCVESVCKAAADARNALLGVKVAGDAAIGELKRVAPTVDCLIYGPEYTICDNGLPTFAEQWRRLNRLSIGSIAEDHAVATTGQTTVTLGGPVPNVAALEVWVNGSELDEPRDWTLAGSVLTFKYPLTAGDQVETRRFGL